MQAQIVTEVFRYVYILRKNRLKIDQSIFSFFCQKRDNNKWCTLFSFYTLPQTLFSLSSSFSGHSTQETMILSFFSVSLSFFPTLFYCHRHPNYVFLYPPLLHKPKPILILPSSAEDGRSHLRLNKLILLAQTNSVAIQTKQVSLYWKHENALLANLN